MALSVLASVAPLLFSSRSKTAYCAAVFIGELIVCMTYQAASGILPLLVLVIALRRWCAGKDAKEVLAFVLLAAGAYLAALLFFKLFLMQPASTYVSNGLPPLSELPAVFVEHIRSYITYVLTDFRRLWLGFFALIVIAFIWIMVRDTKRNRILTLFLTLACLLLMVCLSFGVYPAFKSPLFAPRAMYGVGAFIAFIAIVIASSPRILSGKLVITALSWCFFVFAFTYGNALYIQAQWTDFRITSVVEDLASLPEFMTDTPKSIQVKGSIGQSPILRNQPQSYQMLNRLVPITFEGGWPWGVTGFENYYGLSNVTVDGNAYVADPFDESLPLLETSIFHTIYGNGKDFLIVLK